MTTATPCTTATEAATEARPAHHLPSIHMRALLTWIAVFTALSVVQLVIGPYVAGFPMPLRTLALTAVVVPTVVYGLVPTLLKARAAVLRRRPSTGS
ncbi:hypothetical protein [Streptomyces sp. LN549]|uniref:hypothetical protein n=1 Tax=Streptomyces sp. LN549 TaxID=3112979 RepID=UPI0037121A8B